MSEVCRLQAPQHAGTVSISPTSTSGQLPCLMQLFIPSTQLGAARHYLLTKVHFLFELGAQGVKWLAKSTQLVGRGAKLRVQTGLAPAWFSLFPRVGAPWQPQLDLPRHIARPTHLPIRHTAISTEVQGPWHRGPGAQRVGVVLQAGRQAKGQAGPAAQEDVDGREDQEAEDDEQEAILGRQWSQGMVGARGPPRSRLHFNSPKNSQSPLTRPSSEVPGSGHMKPWK